MRETKKKMKKREYLSLREKNEGNKKDQKYDTFEKTKKEERKGEIRKQKKGNEKKN